MPKNSIPRATGALLLVCVCGWKAVSAVADERPPNIVIVMADDMGYGDLGCYGNRSTQTPHIDRLAAEGARFTDFYVPQAVCSASRAALLTGCYPNRVSILGALGPKANHGLHPDEQTLAELVKPLGYATAAIGKWHLGDDRRFLPKQNGFDVYFGLPYSNDMWPRHPELPGRFPPLPLIDGDEVIEIDPDQSQLTTRYAERAVKFIDENHERPFLLYVAHSMPHVPLFVSDKFQGKYSGGLYADVVAEIDWSVGQIVDALSRHGLQERTLVIFTSDNGPWLSYGDHAGSAGEFREGKGTSFEGGVRMPFVACWPGRIQAGRTCAEPAMTIDMLPTIAALCGAPIDPDRKIDGLDIGPLLWGDPADMTPRSSLWFYWGRELQSVRAGRWKMHLPHAYRTLNGPAGAGGTPAKYAEARIGLALYDLEADPGESRDLAAEHPEVVERLMQIVEEARADLGDSAAGRTGSGVRPHQKISAPN